MYQADGIIELEWPPMCRCEPNNASAGRIYVLTVPTLHGRNHAILNTFGPMENARYEALGPAVVPLSAINVISNLSGH